ncbi:MAG: HlyD family secretion protein [Candidatus Omnitrophica bacterium]|nr:HlyD family secretion protein [Candidatus Omnitrophota bacterium]
MAQTNNNKLKLIIVLLIAALLIGGFSVFYVIRGFSRVTTDDAYIEGRIHSIASKIYGTALQVYVEDNKSVRKGELLLEIDPADYELKVHEATAALDAENARLQDAQAGIKTAAAGLEIQKVSLSQAVLDKERAEALFKEGVITQEKHEKVTTAFNLASAEVKAAEEQLEKAKSLKTLEESLVKQKEASLNIAKLNLSYTKIYAPSDGYITRKSVEVGNQLQAGQPVMAVVPLDDIWIVANFKETQFKNVRTGQPVIVKVDAYPGKVFQAKVESIMAGTGAVFSLFPPENALGNYVKVVQRIPVKIVFDKAAGANQVLRIGMSCVPTIITKNE